MINRVTSSPTTWGPGQWLNSPQDISGRQISTLVRYVLVVTCVCAIGCLYLWQTSTMAEIGRQTSALETEAARLEAETSFLMGQLAQWYSPAYIDQRSQELGLTHKIEPVYVKIQPAAMAETQAAETASLAQRLVGVLPALGPLGESIGLPRAPHDR